MSQIPRDGKIDNTYALLKEGYQFISKRCKKYNTDIFETRIMLRKAICIKGEEAARVFYQPNRFTRNGAMPKTTLLLLQDEGSVATLDKEAHHLRKKMFMSIMTPESIQQLTNRVEEEWLSAVSKWTNQDEVVFYDAVEEILCRAVCRWTGVPLEESEAEKRTRELDAMIDGSGSIGLRNWRGLLLRTRTEKWIKEIIKQVRNQQIHPNEESALYIFSFHKDPHGNLLDIDIATVELINLLRPTVAIALYIIFAALALHEHPEYQQRLQSGDEDFIPNFVQEVRRYYPFFPFIGGRVLEEFEWRNHKFTQGTWVILDLYGTNHDERIWQHPEQFNPDRFLHHEVNEFNFIPQGGGDYIANHRCAGEHATLEIMKRMLLLLNTKITYEVPEQDLRINLSRMPALPKSRFIISNVRQK